MGQPNFVAYSPSANTNEDDCQYTSSSAVKSLHTNSSAALNKCNQYANFVSTYKSS